jgi:DNA-binding GntR family transcriptional regulator
VDVNSNGNANRIASSDRLAPGSAFGPISRENLTGRVYAELRDGLLHGRFWPGERLIIRDLAKAMQISETPVREAVLQIAREAGFEIVAGRSIRVVSLSVAQYLELRRIRLELEGLAGEIATPRIPPEEIDRMERLHEVLCDARTREDWPAVIRAGCEFHFRLYEASGMPELMKFLEQIWMRTAPLLNLLYRHAPYSNPGRHHHLALIDALRARDAAAVRKALADDLIQGGEPLVKLMQDIEAGRVSVA